MIDSGSDSDRDTLISNSTIAFPCAEGVESNESLLHFLHAPKSFPAPEMIAAQQVAAQQVVSRSIHIAGIIYSKKMLDLLHGTQHGHNIPSYEGKARCRRCCAHVYNQILPLK
jgi:hypothetical protein